MLKSKGGPLEGLNFHIVPGSSASNLARMVSLAVGFADDFLVIVDSDSAGRDAMEEIGEFGSEQISDRVIAYSDGKNSRLEDLLDAPDVEKILEITSVKKVKKAIPLLYWDHRSDVDEFVASLSPETKKRLKPITKKIRAMCDRS